MTSKFPKHVCDKYKYLSPDLGFSNRDLGKRAGNFELFSPVNFTLTANGKREFVPRDQVFHLHVIYHLLPLPFLSIRTVLYHFHVLIFYFDTFSTWIWREFTVSRKRDSIFFSLLAWFIYEQIWGVRNIHYRTCSQAILPGLPKYFDFKTFQKMKFER